MHSFHPYNGNKQPRNRQLGKIRIWQRQIGRLPIVSFDSNILQVSVQWKPGISIQLDWVADSEWDFSVRAPVFIYFRHLYIIFWPRALSITLDRAGNMNLGMGMVKTVMQTPWKNTWIYLKCVSKDPWSCWGVCITILSIPRSTNSCHRHNLVLYIGPEFQNCDQNM